ncbi:MAG: hypothetical protein ACFHWX_13210 [Bacteroidota bacterium]
MVKNRVLIFDNSTIRGHHSVYINGVVKALQQDPENQIFLVTADNGSFNWIDGIGENVSFLNFSYPTWAKGFVRFFRLIKLFNFIRALELFLVNQLAGKNGIDLIFFPHMDSTLSELNPFWLHLLIKKPFSGIYLRPFNDTLGEGYTRFMSLVKLKQVRKILLLDELLYNKVRKSDENKIVHIPELLLQTETDKYVEEEVYKSSKGRIIISIIGSHVSRKRLAPFLLICKPLDPERFFVVVEGLIPEDQYEEAELEQIQSLIKTIEANGNLRFVDDYIKTEEHFNALYKVSDLIWLSYLNHPYTSNAIIKAIYYKAGVLSNKACEFIEVMAKRYNHPLLDETEVSQQSLIEYGHRSISNEDYSRFLKDFSFKRFSGIVRESLR